MPLFEDRSRPSSMAVAKTDRQPGRDHRPDGSVGPVLGHVRREGRRDPQAEQPAGQGRDRDPVPGRVQHHHRAGVHQAVDRGRLQPGGDPALAVRPDDRIRVPVRDICCDPRHSEHGRRRGQADGAVDAARGVRTFHRIAWSAGWLDPVRIEGVRGSNPSAPPSSCRSGDLFEFLTLRWGAIVGAKSCTSGMAGTPTGPATRWTAHDQATSPALTSPAPPDRINQ
jgi:hypothetical protein